MRSALAALIGLAVLLVVAAAPAAAQTSGSETFKGFIVAGYPDGPRVVHAGSVVARGVFDGAGRIVEVDSLPGDPDGVVRDDLVFSAGTLHLVSTAQDVSVALDSRSCVLSVTIQQTGVVSGGTGRFAAASGSFTGTVEARIVATRNAGGSCSDTLPAHHERDALTATGTLSY
jgi:hypothetical protein